MRRRGRSRHVEEYLSPDLCREILCRLPVKDLLRLRLVCKTWRSLIDDPQFVSLHLSSYKNNVEGSDLLVPEWRSEQFYPIIRRSDTFRKVGEYGGSPLNGIGEHYNLDIAGHVNGLFVLWSEINPTNIMVWNPSIRRHFVLSPFPWSSPGVKRLGFGFDPSTNDYKVVSVCQQYGFCEPVPTTVYLYTFESGRWRVISSGHHFPFFPLAKSAFIKGVIYWATWRGLYLFDVGKETLSCCSVPDYGSIVEKSVDIIPVIFRESLALLTNKCDHYCLWVRDQYANWMKLHTINIDAPRHRFMCVKINGEMLFKIEKAVCSYNMNTHEMKVLAKSYYRYVNPAFEYVAFEYVESLVWPMGV